jgi:hypothetical protein
VAGELVRPKNIIVGSKSPSLALKAPFHSSPSLMHMLLYPHWILNLVNNFFPAKSWIKSVMRGRGYLLGIVQEFRCQ